MRFEPARILGLGVLLSSSLAAAAPTLAVGPPMQPPSAPVEGTITVGAVAHTLNAIAFFTDTNLFTFPVLPPPVPPSTFQAAASVTRVGNVAALSTRTATSSSLPNVAVNDYTFMGEYIANDAPLGSPVTQLGNHVTVAFSPTVAVGLALAGKNWNAAFNLDFNGRTTASSTAFSLFIGSNMDFSENTIYSALSDFAATGSTQAPGGGDTLLRFFAYADSQTYTDALGNPLGVGLPKIGSAGTLVDFSNATLEAGGSTTAAVTPEPLGSALVSIAAALLMRRRRSLA